MTKAITAIRESLAQPAQPEQEPVAWYTEEHLTDRSATTFSKEMADKWKAKGWPITTLYTSPPKLQPLTDEQIADMCAEANRGFCIEIQDYRKAVRDTEAAHNIAISTKETP